MEKSFECPNCGFKCVIKLKDIPYTNYRLHCIKCGNFISKLKKGEEKR